MPGGCPDKIKRICTKGNDPIPENFLTDVWYRHIYVGIQASMLREQLPPCLDLVVWLKTGQKQEELFKEFRQQFRNEFEDAEQNKGKGFTLLQFLNDLAFSINFAITWHKDPKWRNEIGSPAPKATEAQQLKKKLAKWLEKKTRGWKPE